LRKASIPFSGASTFLVHSIFSSLPSFPPFLPPSFVRVNGATLKCESAGDVMLLLKSSDRVQHDLDRLKEMVRREGGREGRRDGRGVWCF